MFRATMTKISLPYGIFLTKVFKYFKIDLNNEKKRTAKSISNEYNEKTKKMGYILKNNKQTHKSTKKTGGDSASKVKTPSRSSSRQRSTKKALIHKFKGNEMEMCGFMTQVIELLEKLNQKNEQYCNKNIISGKKVRELKNEVKLLRLGK